MKVTNETASKIQNLRYDPKAEIIYCPLPLGSIYFSDEVPEDLLPGSIKDYIGVMRILAVRVNIWDETASPAEEQALFETAREQFPLWPIFMRLQLSPEQRLAHESALEDVVEGLSLDDFNG